MYQRKPMKVGIGIGAFGVALAVLISALLVLPQELSVTTRSIYLETAYRPLLAMGWGLRAIGMPVLSAAFAFYLMAKNHSATSVLIAFVVAGVLLGSADLVIGYFGGMSRTIPDLIVYSRLALAVVAGALVGMLSATVASEDTKEIVLSKL